MKRMKAAEVILDYELYPRNNVDSKNVTMLVDALAAGDELPPVLIDQKSKRVIDGFHRVKAHLRHFGDDAEIEVISKAYKNEADMFLEAMRLNASHGAKLDPCDRTHCVIVATRLGLTIDLVAGALHMPVDKLGELHNGRTATCGALTIPLKQTVRHMAGKKINKRQCEANQRLSGMNQSFYANQLIELIESKLIDLENDKTLASLQRLHGLLDELLVAA